MDDFERDGEISHCAAYHAIKQWSAPTAKVDRTVLPIFHEFAGILDMMKHSLATVLSKLIS